MALTLVTAATREPVSLEEAKDHLRYTATDQDALIDALIRTALESVEQFTSRAVITQTWDLKRDRFPSSAAAPLRVPRAPLQSVTSITYIDNDGVSQTWASSEYDVDAPSGPLAPRGRILPAYSKTWPTTREVMNAVTVRFIAGYGDDGGDAPASIRQAMLLTISHLFQNREDVVVGVSAIELPQGVPALLWNYRASAR